MNKKLQESSTGVFHLFDCERSGIAHRVAEHVSAELPRLPQVLEKYGRPIDKHLLRGVFFNGGYNFVKQTEEERVRAWLKDSPLAESSRSRLVSEAIAAIPAGLEPELTGVLNEIWNSFSRVPDPPRNEDFKFTDTEIILLPSYLKHVDAALTMLVPLADIELAKEFKSLAERIAELSAMGYNVTGREHYYIENDQPRQLHYPGIIEKIVGHPDEFATTEQILPLMYNNRKQ